MSNPFASSPPPVFGQPAAGYEQPSSLVPLDDEEVGWEEGSVGASNALGAPTCRSRLRSAGAVPSATAVHCLAPLLAG